MNRRTLLGAAGIGGLMVAAGVPVARQLVSTVASEAALSSTVYIGSYTSWGTPAGPGFQVGTADPVTGKLTITGTVAGVADPSWFAYSADGRILYSTNEGTPGAVTAIDISSDQQPKVLATAAVKGNGPTHIARHGQFLLTANYTSGDVSVLKLGADGKPGAVTDVVAHGTGAHAHQVVTDPSGQWLLAVDLGTDSVYVYKVDGAGKLTQNQQLKLPAGTGPRHLAFHPDGKRAFILAELNSTLTVAGWDAASGTLTAGKVLSTLGGATPAENYPGEVQVSPDGRFVYATNRGHESIATFSVGSDVSFVETVPSGGSWPRHLILDPTGKWVYVSNQRAGTVNWLPRDLSTGRLGPSVGSVSVGNVGVVSFK
ncbi:lactonase family protein [Pseudonocardiaceae bacterium YIM PH 21723]|nr:lactonase family protein [Pseudonocardiaceae bacterium YIM PH 21723]